MRLKQGVQHMRGRNIMEVNYWQSLDFETILNVQLICECVLYVKIYGTHEGQVCMSMVFCLHDLWRYDLDLGYLVAAAVSSTLTLHWPIWICGSPMKVLVGSMVGMSFCLSDLLSLSCDLQLGKLENKGECWCSWIHPRQGCRGGWGSFFE